MAIALNHVVLYSSGSEAAARRFAASPPSWSPLDNPLPSFFDKAWAAAAVDRLEADLCRGAAFAAPAGSAVHGDLYGGNVIVGPQGDIRILDWDDLHGGGDPALDATMLLGPLLLRGRGQDLLAAYAGWVGDPGVLARAPLYRRALLLDQIVDTLSDYAATERSERTPNRARHLPESILDV